MRARYYSPDMRRFVNADIVAGEISNAITLNRFAYANGNPVSFVDPFGLEAVREGIPQEYYDIFIETLDKLFILSKSYDGDVFRLDTGMLIYYLSYGMTVGNGPIDVDQFILGQIELSQSIDFSKGTFNVSTGSEYKLELEFSFDIDDYNSASASMTINLDNTVDAQYVISSNYENGFSFSTIMGVQTKRMDIYHKYTLRSIYDITDRLEIEAKEPSFLEEVGNFFEDVNDTLQAIGNSLNSSSEFLTSLGIGSSLGVVALLPIVLLV